jgi:hypothetical protein
MKSVCANTGASGNAREVNKITLRKMDRMESISDLWRKPAVAARIAAITSNFKKSRQMPTTLRLVSAQGGTQSKIMN